MKRACQILKLKIINLDIMLVKRKMKSKDLAEIIGITPANLSILKSGKAKAIRFSTLAAISDALACQPGDIIAYSDLNKHDKLK